MKLPVHQKNEWNFFYLLVKFIALGWANVARRNWFNFSSYRKGKKMTRSALLAALLALALTACGEKPAEEAASAATDAAQSATEAAGEAATAATEAAAASDAAAPAAADAAAAAGDAAAAATDAAAAATDAAATAEAAPTPAAK